MKIAFVGKGGSGKTTVSSLLALYLQAQNKPVICLDADINQHMADALMIKAPHTSLSDIMGELKEMLAGTNKLLIPPSHMIKTTPPGKGSKILNTADLLVLAERYGARFGEKGALFTAGAFNDEDIGVRCYHSKTGAVELLLNHYKDDAKEYCITDMTAGADAFASGLFTRFDLTVIVVEPTSKSLGVYDQYKERAAKHNVHFKVLANKLEDNSDLDFIRSRVGQDLLAAIPRLSYVKLRERGEGMPIGRLDSSGADALDIIINELDTTPKDWKAYFSGAVEFHKKNALSWANKSAGFDLTSQIDTDFSY